MKIAIGFSQDENCLRAAESVSQQVKKQIGQSQIDLILLVSTPRYSPKELLPAVTTAFNNPKIIGGTTAGIILNDGLKRHGIAILAICSETITFQSSHASHLNLKDLGSAGQSFAKEFGAVASHKGPRALLFFFDGLLENMSSFIAGIQKESGQYLPLMGAGTSDPLLFSKTFQYQDNAVCSAGVSGVMIDGAASIPISRCHGWKPLGKPRLAKKTNKNIIEKIGDQPAIRLYEEFFKDNLGALKNDAFGKLNARYPIGIFTKPKQEYLLRNIMDILEDGSLVCHDEVPEGSEIHIMIGNKTSCLQSAADAARDLKQRLKNTKPLCLIMFESAMRLRVLKHSWPEEFKVIKHVLGKDLPLFGMLTYGEICNPGTLISSGNVFVQSGNMMLAAIVS